MLKWIITDGSRYIYRDKRGSYVPSFQKDSADVFDTKQKADAVFHNCLPKPLRKVFQVEKIQVSSDNVKNIKNNNIVDDKELNCIKPVTNNDIQKNTEKTEEADNIKIWIIKAHQLNNLFAEAIVRKNELKKQLSSIDREIEDVLHYLEFTNLNAAQGYKTYKMLKEKRINRRSIKNELEIVNVILDKEPISSIEDEIAKKIQQLDSRTYEPRIMSELFDL